MVELWSTLRICLVTHLFIMLFVKSTFWKWSFELHSQNVIFEGNIFCKPCFFLLTKHKIWILHFQNMFFAFLTGFQTGTEWALILLHTVKWAVYWAFNSKPKMNKTSPIEFFVLAAQNIKWNKKHIYYFGKTLKKPFCTWEDFGAKVLTT